MQHPENHPNCVAHWNFEGASWLQDVKSGLLLSGAPAATQDTSVFWDGAASAKFLNTQSLSITDGNLPAGFPLKSGDTSKFCTYAFAFNGGSTTKNLFGKWSPGAGGSFLLKYDYGYIDVLWGYSGASYETWNYAAGVGAGWNTVLVMIDGNNKFLALCVNGAWVFKTWANVIQADTSPLIMGLNSFAGNIDSVTVFNTRLNGLETFKFYSKVLNEKLGNNQMANDPACQALWNFEPGQYLTDASGKANDLTLSTPYGPGGYNNAAKGACGLYSSGYGGAFYAQRTDGNLSANFPLKVGSPTRKFTVVSWYEPTRHNFEGGPLWGKLSPNHGMRLNMNGTSPAPLQITWGLGSSEQTLNSGITVTKYRFYHVALAVDLDAPSVHLRVYDVLSGTATNYDGVPSGPMSISGNPFAIGSDGYYSYGEADCHDEFAVFSRILSDAEIDQIRAGSFAPAFDPPYPARSATLCPGIVALLSSLKSLTLCPGVTDPPPAGLDSPTLCPAIQPMINLLRSHTLAEDVPTWRPGSCQSATLCQALLMALPNSCVSKTLASDLALDGGDFFLTF